MKGIKKILISLVTVAMLLCVGTVNVFADNLQVNAVVEYQLNGVTIETKDHAVTIERNNATDAFATYVSGDLEFPVEIDGTLYDKAETDVYFTLDTSTVATGVWKSYLPVKEYDPSKTVKVFYNVDGVNTLADTIVDLDGDNEFPVEDLPGYDATTGRITFNGKEYVLLDSNNTIYYTVDTNESFVSVKEYDPSKTVKVYYNVDGVNTLADTIVDLDGDNEFPVEDLPGYDATTGRITFNGKEYVLLDSNNTIYYTVDTNESFVSVKEYDPSKTVKVYYNVDGVNTLADTIVDLDGDNEFPVEDLPGYDATTGRITFNGKEYVLLDSNNTIYYTVDTNESFVSVKEYDPSKTVKVYYNVDGVNTLADTIVDLDGDNEFPVEDLPGYDATTGRITFNGKEYVLLDPNNTIYYTVDTNESFVSVKLATKEVKIVYLPENGNINDPLDSEVIEVASVAEKFEATSLTKVTDGVFEKDGVKYTTEYNGYIIENKDGTYTGIVNVIKINNEVDTTLFVNLKYGDLFVGQVILHKTSEKNDPVTFKYEDYRDQLEVVANGVRYYVPETKVGDFAWTLKEGGEAEVNVDVTADEVDLTLTVNFIYNGSNPIATVYLHHTVLLGESYKFTMEDLEEAVPGLKFESNNLECLNGAIEFTIPEGFLSGDQAEVSSLETKPHVYESDVVPATAAAKLVVEFECNGVTVGDPVELVKENLIKTTTYKFTTEDLKGELPSLTFWVGNDKYKVIDDSNAISGERATVTAGDDGYTCSVKVKLDNSANTGGSSSSTTNTTTKPVVNTSAK